MTTSHPDGVTLSDYADGALPEPERARVLAHLTVCAECQATVDSFGAVRSAARNLPPLEAPRQAWPRIERKLRADQAAHGGGRIARWTWLAAAAVLVAATVVGIRLVEVGRRPAPAAATSPAASSTEASSDAPTAQSIEAELVQAEQHYQNAIAGLEKIANAEKGSLDPQTAATLEKNLTVVDQAISESRAALRAQPASEPAQASLLENFKTKVALLQETVALINEMRKAAQKGN